MAAYMEDEQEYPLNKVSFVLKTSTKEEQLVNRGDAITQTLNKL